MENLLDVLLHNSRRGINIIASLSHFCALHVFNGTVVILDLPIPTSCMQYKLNDFLTNTIHVLV